MENKNMDPKDKYRGLKIFLIIGGVIFILILFGAISSGLQDNSLARAGLSANVSTNSTGIVITNQETVDWTGCAVGVNYEASGITNPPFHTHQNLIIGAGQTVTVPYSSISGADGTLFSIERQAVNSIVIACSVGTDFQFQRVWGGTTK